MADSTPIASDMAAASGAPAPEPHPPVGRWRVSPRLADLLRRESAAAPRRHIPERLPTAQDSAVGPVVPGIEQAAPPEDAGVLADDRVPAWLVSLIVHMAVVILLAFFTLDARGDRSAVRLSVEWMAAGGANTPVQQIALADASVAASAVGESPSEQPVTVAESLEPAPIAIPSPLAEAPLDPSLAPPILDAQADRVPPRLDLPLSRGELGDRSPRGRADAVRSGATTPQAEDAIERALRWLAIHQHNDGGWSFRLDEPSSPCRGQCENHRQNTDDAPIPRTAATGLALLAFLGAGHTHQQGEYAETVRRGIYYLRGQAAQSSMGLDLQNGSMYGHGIATLALAEAYVLTGDEDLRSLIQGASMFSAGAQHTSGGWGYIPGGPPDITLTGWQVVAMKTGEQKDIAIPTLVIPKAKQYLETLGTDDQSQFGYKTPEPKLSTTAIGLLLRLYFGAFPDQTSMRRGLDWIAEEGPSPTDVYYDYYAMLALHHSQHDGRLDFARAIRDHLIATQATSGHESGSWNFRDRYGSVGGRLYTTAMCVLILETPYRYIPIHNPHRPFEL